MGDRRVDVDDSVEARKQESGQNSEFESASWCDCDDFSDTSCKL